MSPVAVLIAAWLLVLGYGLAVIGWTNFNGGSLSFAQAFLGRGGASGQPSSQSTQSGGSTSFGGRAPTTPTTSAGFRGTRP